MSDILATAWRKPVFIKAGTFSDGQPRFIPGTWDILQTAPSPNANVETFIVPVNGADRTAAALTLRDVARPEDIADVIGYGYLTEPVYYGDAQTGSGTTNLGDEMYHLHAFGPI